jgi:hypothetical protein
MNRTLFAGPVAITSLTAQAESVEDDRSFDLSGNGSSDDDRNPSNSNALFNLIQKNQIVSCRLTWAQNEPSTPTSTWCQCLFTFFRHQGCQSSQHYIVDQIKTLRARALPETLGRCSGTARRTIQLHMNRYSVRRCTKHNNSSAKRHEHGPVCLSESHLL